MANFLSDYYEVRLRQLENDDGTTPSNRELAALQRSGAATEGIPIESQQTIANNQERQLLGEVMFNVSPNVTESRQINYNDSPIPSPAAIVVYETTSNRRFNIEARFISREITEAILNFQRTRLLRSWSIPKDASGFGGRPPILRLNGYKNQFFNIPVAIASMNFSFPEDIDYIETPLAMVPIIQTVSLELIESHGAVNIIRQSGVADTPSNEFDLARFRDGRLEGY